MKRRSLLIGAGIALRGSPNDTVRIACVGLRGRGRDHIREFSRLPKVEIAALCDVDEAILAQREKDASGAGSRPALFTDFRRLLDDKSIDAVAIATQNHWHALQTIWACQAGKDVYVEKPCTHNVFESRQIVAAARRYNRIVQQGSQARSAAPVREAMAHLHNGLLGNIYLARGICFNRRDTIGRAKPEPVPRGVHYDLWVGPAPMKPFTRNRFHYNWHWQWDYGNGDIGNQGIHEMDVARWGLGVTYPVKVSAVGGHVMFDDDQETPNILNASFEFDAAGNRKYLNFEVRHWYGNSEAGIGAGDPEYMVGNIFYGPKGFLVRERFSYRTFFGNEQAPGPSGAAREAPHFDNFIRAVRSRKRSDLNAEIEEGAASCVLVHLANISYRLGRTLHFDPEALKCIGDEEANRFLTCLYRAPYTVPELA